MNDSNPIRIAHITPTISHQGGGVAEFLWSNIREGRPVGLEPHVAALWDPSVEADTAPQRQAGIPIFTGKFLGPRSVGYSPALARYLRRDLPEVDLVHSHGIRMLPSYEARRLADRRRLPRIVSPHGQFDPWVLGSRRVAKRLLHLLYEDRNLRTADCLHATAALEARQIRGGGLTNPIAIIPIGLDAHSYDLPRNDAAILERWPELRGQRRLLFLSSIHKKKNLPILARAWVRLHQRFPDWRLVVTGLEISDDRQIAEQVLRDGGAIDRATFTGPVSIDLKRAMLASCDLYCLPTAGENWSIAIAEAMAAGLPVITTVTTPWGVLCSHDAGWWIEVGLEPLCTALEDALPQDEATLRAKGARGKSVIQARYTWPRIVAQMRETYLWLLKRGDKPAFVLGEGEGTEGLRD